MMVAEICGEVIGCCGVKVGTKEGGPTAIIRQAVESRCSVWRLSVAVSARHHGVGTALMEHAEEWARHVGATEMWLMTGNKAAGQFYERIGYRKASWAEALGPWYTKSIAHSSL